MQSQQWPQLPSREYIPVDSLAQEGHLLWIQQLQRLTCTINSTAWLLPRLVGFVCFDLARTGIANKKRADVDIGTENLKIAAVGCSLM